MSAAIIISAVVIEISLFFSMYKQLQMLQQNSYFPSRYFKWIKESFVNEITLLSFGFCLNSFLWMGRADYLSLGLCVIVLIIRIILAIKTRNKSIKKLVFTSRIKRFIAAAVLLTVLSDVCLILLKDSIESVAVYTVITLFAFISPLFVMLMRFILSPLETAFSRYYIKDAEKILRKNDDLKVIGITGSFGKTTTKFILNRILSEKFNTLCTPKSFNTPMGVVRTVRENMKPADEVFICEMGAKKKGDIKEICDICHPGIGIITSVGAQHLDTFGSIDNVYNTKFELSLEVAKNGGKTYVNLDCAEISGRIDRSSTDFVFVGEGTDYFVSDIKRNAFGSNFNLNLRGTVIPVSTKLLGLHSIYDILLAAAVGFDLGVSADDIRVAVSSLKPAEHRLELKSSVNGSLLIDDAYNSNPVGCLEAVRTLGTFDNMKKVIITPGLIELGDKEYEANYALGLEAAKFCDIIILVGINRSKPLMDAINSTGFDKDKVFVVSSFMEAMGVYSGFADKNSVVLLENDLPDNYLN